MRFKKHFDFKAMIRSLELVHGKNGWHPHTHELWFVMKDPPGQKNSIAEALQVEILRMWESACKKAGLLNDECDIKHFRLHAVHVLGNCSNSEYIAKQSGSRNGGVDREIAKGSKLAGQRGVPPFDLLRQGYKGDKRAKQLFLKFALAIKGKAQIYWSPGFKKLVGLSQKTDEKLAAEQREEADVLGRIELTDWRNVRNAEQRAQVLSAAEIGGWQAVEKLITALRPIGR